MRYILLILAFLLILGASFYKQKSTSLPAASSTPIETNSSPAVQVIAEGLDTPWAIAFLPDNSMLVTERPGRVRLIDANGELDPAPVATLSQVKEVGEGGLLGIAIDPDFSKNKLVYLYYTYAADNDNTRNRVIYMTYTNKKLSNEEVLFEGILGAANHNGGRMKFGPDNYLYITTGDAQDPSHAQDIGSMAGKILRQFPKRETPSSPIQVKPYGVIYSYGHRNPQGLAWDKKGQLWATEHGRSGIQSGFDEINHIEKGKNYGWPTIQGDETKEGMMSPVFHSGASSTWAPAGAAFVGDSLFFGGLRGQTLYEAVIKNNKVIELKEHLKGKYGRIREVVLGPDGMLYITTSNKDGRGLPGETDDRVIRIDPKQL